MHEVPAARAGQVTFAGELAGYGLTVVVQHDGDDGHALCPSVRGDRPGGGRVAAGQVIAKSGASGRATGAHLHFEWLRRRPAVDPKGVIKD